LKDIIAVFRKLVRAAEILIMQDENDLHLFQAWAFYWKFRKRRLCQRTVYLQFFLAIDKKIWIYQIL